MITLIVPTMNRSDFLIRQLHYYRDIGFKGCIAISDSSSDEHIQRTKKEIDSLKSSINIIYQVYPQKSDIRGQQKLIESVSTPYVAILPDDDFLVPASIEKCEAFLNTHPDYVAASGTGMIMCLQSSGPYGQVAWVHPYERPVIEGETAAQRILGHLKKYTTTLFSVHRIETWRTMYRDAHLVNDDKTFSWELLPCCLSVISGKVKDLDCLYLMRQEHPQRYLLPGKYDWIKNPKWPGMYQVFVNVLARELVQKDGITTQESEGIIKQSFDSYMVNLLGDNWRNRMGKGNTGIEHRLQVIARNIPGALPVWRRLNAPKPERQVENELESLLKSSSPYHEDFMPIYRAVTATHE